MDVRLNLLLFTTSDFSHQFLASLQPLFWRSGTLYGTTHGLSIKGPFWISFAV